MITQNYENLLAAMLASSSSKFGSLPVVSVDGLTKFLNNTFSNFPYSRITDLTTSKTAAGISVGTGSTEPTKMDINLEETIERGVTLTLVSTSTGCDAPGSPFVEYTITVTNTGSDPITICEIGYKQTLNGAVFPGDTQNSSAVCLLDRTVLSYPITIQAGDAGVIKYKLSTVPGRRQKGGVELVSFTWGPDEKIAAMIDAARQGIIDLQEDGGWRVGDVRTIHVGEFVGATNTNPEQDIDIVISQFGDYNFCGSLFQFDFRKLFSADQKMNDTSSAVGGYGSMTMMIDTTLPAIVEALPTWLKTRLKTFAVSAHSDYTTVVTVPNNKLALRSYSELTGVSTGGFAGEGTQIQLYKPSANVRSKPKDRSSTQNVGYFTRSLSYNGTTPNGFMAGRLNNPVPNWQGEFANTSIGIAPFGCI